MTLLQIPWRQGLPLALVMATALLLAYVSTWPGWLGVWSETQNNIGGALILGLPTAAGIGAWVGTESRRSGHDELQLGAGRPPLVVAFREYAETAAWVGLGYLLGSAPGIAATSITAQFDRPRLLPVVAQLLCVLGVTATGQLLGARLPWFLGAPICVAVAYVSLGFFSFYADEILIAISPINERGMTFHLMLWWVLVLQAVFWGLLFAHAVLSRAGHANAAFGVLVVCGLAVSPLLFVTPELRVVSTPAVELSCTEIGANDVSCLPAAKSLLEEDLEVATKEAFPLLKGLLPSAVALVDDEARGVSGGADRTIEVVAQQQNAAGREVIYLAREGFGLDATTQLDRGQFLYRLVAFVVPPSALDSSQGDIDFTSVSGVATPPDVIHRWYLQQLGIPADGSGWAGAPPLDQLDYQEHAEAVARFEAMTQEKRATWFLDHAEAISRGQLDWSDLEQSVR